MSKTIEMKDLGEGSFILGINIHRDRSRGLLHYLKRPILIMYLNFNRGFPKYFKL